MRIKVLGSGPSTGVNKTGKSHRMPSSILIDNKILVDATPVIVKQLKDKTIEAILITHAHEDACLGLKYIERFMNKIVDVYAFGHTINNIKQKIGQKPYIRYNILKPYKKYDILDYKIIPFPVSHSVIFTRFDPTAAYKINNMIYCEDIDQDFFLSKYRSAWLLKREMAKSSLVLLDGAICKGKLKGHLNIWDILPELEKWKMKNIYFTQIGNNCPVHEKLLKMIRLKNPTFNVCYDGMTIDIQNLDEKFNRGITKDLPVEDITDTDLIGIHSILHVWYQKGKSEWSQEDIWNLHKRITEEMQKRGLRHLPKDLLDKDIKIHTLGLINNLPDEIILQKGTVQLVGSFVEKQEYHDIDFNIRLGQGDFVRRAITVRIDKLDIPSKKHIFYEPEGAHDKFIDIYDLKLIKRQDAELIEMSEIPQKPLGKAYYHPEDMVIDMFKQYDKWIVEKKWDGFHAMIKKKGDNVSIIAESGKNITIGFPTLCEDAKKLSDKDFVIDGELVYKKNDTFGTRRDLMKFIQGKKMDDRNIEFHVWDISFYGKPVTNLKLYERKNILKILHWTNRIVQTGFVSVNSKESALSAIKKKSVLPRSEGAVVKQIDAVYQRGEKSKVWLKYRKMADLNVLILKKNTAGSVFNYSIGIILNENDIKKINPKYMNLEFDNKKVLLLGSTFNTSISGSVGEILAIKTEEIWRHEGPKGIRYSLHKPRVQSLRPDIKTTSTLRNLDDIVVALGIAIKEGLEVMIANPKNYPNIIGDLDDEVLLDDHRIVHAWTSSIKSGKKLYHKDGSEITLKECKYLHSLIVTEMKKRNFEHDSILQLAKMDGIIMVSPHGKMIWDGSKTLIVKSKKFDIAGRFFYLIENGRCYGILKITTVEKITPKEFDEFRNLHKITDEEKNRWWENKNEFYAYQFNLVTRYISPRKVRVPQGVQTFVKGKNIELLQEKEFKNQIVGQNDKPIRDFPPMLQADFRHIMENKLKPRFVIHHHERGRSLHSDVRLQIPNKNYLQGFTLANPANISQEDNVNNDAKNVLVVEVKPPQPDGWLKYEGISVRGEPGSTAHKAGIFTIVAKGTYSIWEVSDHKIGIEFNCDKGKVKDIKDRLKQDYDNLKDLKGDFSFTIAHIQPERWVGYFNHLKSKPVQVKMFENPYIHSLLEDLSIALGNQPVFQRIELESSIREELGKDFKLPYEFNFIALKEGEFNGVWYSKEELIKAYPTLKGKDLTIDHGKSVRDVIGKVKDTWWNDELEQIEGIAEITDDETIAGKVHKKLITGVSVEVYVTYMKTEHGLSAKDPVFQALSIVTKPACKTCRIINNDVTSD